MKGLFQTRELSEATRRRVELAVAVSQERLVSTHVQHALHLLQVAGDQLPPASILAIYTRVMRLPGDVARAVTVRAMATLGEQVVKGEDWNEPGEEEREEDGGRHFSLLRLVRARLRGRVKEEFREWVEFAGARAELAVLHTHVENARTFVEVLEKEMPITDAVELYLDTLDVRDSIGEVVYYMVLARIADQHQPRGRNEEGPDAPRLRVMEGEGG